MSEPLPRLNVSIDFFSGAMKLLGKLYKDRACAEPIEEIRNHLAHAEALYKTLPAAPPKPKAERKAAAMIPNAEAIVRQHYANLFVEQKGQKFRIIQRQPSGRPVHLSSLCVSEASAWNTIARRVSR